MYLEELLVCQALDIISLGSDSKKSDEIEKPPETIQPGPPCATEKPPETIQPDLATRKEDYL